MVRRSGTRPMRLPAAWRLCRRTVACSASFSTIRCGTTSSCLTWRGSRGTDFVNDSEALKAVAATIRSMGIKTDGPDKIARLLSGGNQQKIVIGKWLARNPRLLVLDEPTIGVDIGAKSEIVETVRAMADKGAAVLVISSELEELMAFSDRVLVLYGGRITQNIDRRSIATEEELHHAIQGHDARKPAFDVAEASAQ